jgi:hypothetical protein
MIAACEASTEDAEIPFDNIFDSLTGSDPSVTDYILEVPPRRLQWGAEITRRRLWSPTIQAPPERTLADDGRFHLANCSHCQSLVEEYKTYIRAA